MLMIQILHYLKEPKLWRLCKFLIKGSAGFISSTVVPEATIKGLEPARLRVLNVRISGFRV